MKADHGSVTQKHQGIVAVVSLALSLSIFPVNAHAESAWKTHREVDGMSDIAKVSALRTYSVDGGGKFEVEVSCEIGIVNFAYAYFGGGNGRPSLAWQESDTYSGTTFGFSTNLTHNVNRWVPLRVKLDQQSVQSRNSSSKFENQVEIVFYDPAEVKRQAALHASPSTQNTHSGQQNLAGLMSGLSEAVQAMQFQALPTLLPLVAAGTISDLMRSTSLRIEIPLADGRNPVVTIAPNDASLQAFLQGCSGVSHGAGQARQSGGIEGRYADGKGASLILQHGRITISEGGQTSPSMPYSVTGSKITITAPNGHNAQLEIKPDGSLVAPDEPGMAPMRRLD